MSTQYHCKEIFEKMLGLKHLWRAWDDYDEDHDNQHLQVDYENKITCIEEMKAIEDSFAELAKAFQNGEVTYDDYSQYQRYYSRAKDYYDDIMKFVVFTQQ